MSRRYTMTNLHAEFEFYDGASTRFEPAPTGTIGYISRGLSILSHLNNSSYYHYELQQSFYKYILETEYGIKISSMILCILHPDYDRYYTIKLSDYRKDEVEEMVAAKLAVSS